MKGETRQTIWIQLLVVLALVATGLVIWKDLSGWAIGGAAVADFVFITLLVGHMDGIYKIQGQIDRLNAEWTILRELPLSDAKDSSSYFQNLVTINVTNLKEYYFLVKQHTNGSFRAAIGAGIIGFLLILLGLLAGYLKSDLGTVTYIATGAGLITEFISGIFFFLYSKTVRQLKDYHDSLIDVQNVLLSLKLLESVDDPALRAPMITRMLEYLMGIKS
ncbi:hypothetical protein BZG29_16280 [Janthinobacterium sp. LM6]|nr:hypothetical protein BZG29_16280 [Janthinobacterium sp. LM6]